MTADNNNDDFFFEELSKSESAEKPDTGVSDDFDFGDLSWPVEKTGQGDTDIFSFDEEPEPLEKPEQGIEELRRPDVPECQEVLPFTCLKCAAKNEVGFYQIPDTGLTTKCTSCKTNIEIVRDSSAKRAGQLSKELFCAKCGHQLDHHTVCRSCGFLFPDYFVVVNHEEARRQAKSRQSAKFRQAFADFGTSLRPRVSKDVYTPSRPVVTASAKTTIFSGKLRATLVSFVVIAAVIAGGFVYYRQYKAEQAFVTNYVKALYGIKLGTEGSINACAKISREWKATAESTANFVPRVNMDDDVKADKVKAEVDKLMQKLQPAPAKYSQANAKLAELNGIYGNLYALKSSPRGTLDSFNNSTDKADKAFKQTVQELKANLPEKLSKELETAKQRYRGLASL
ncbi:hypothetical protein [Geobacter sp. AOG2]|uniref:hypothetical protein n=1 Tax=Geobacter sp. AOG2 TaxID=1566347 RepID=UPI001CC60321|nr:hypothetical protein [Geobacter sp. AOG2]GFE61670.1 hypothetical protein AOG2_22570 [Geobacter sp. AOG2]